MNKILIIDDEKAIRSAVSMILKYEQQPVVEAESGRRGVEIVQEDREIGAVVCDVKMPGMDGLEALQRIREIRPELPVIMISGHGTVETAVEATRRGAFDFLEKPLTRDRLLVTLRNALDQRALRGRNEALREEISDRYRIIGSSVPMENLRQTIRRVGATDARVLITGENGTGKELVARNLHLQSARRDAPWVEVNCAAIPQDLIESELFGHEKGSFTGAESRKTGRFEQASGGTLFLDEIGDMDLAAQAKVLRALEEGRIQRVGGDTLIPVDVRVIAATNKDLEQAAAAGTFREDLYYRLNVIPLQVPPLRERGDDVNEIFAHFLVQLCKKYNRPPMKIDAGARAHLRGQRWPGNVRELRNVAERVALLITDEVLTAQHLAGLGTARPAPAGEDAIFSIQSFEAFKEAAERAYLLRQLRENGWNIKRTAELLGMQRSNLYKKIERYGLKEAE